MKYIDPTNIKNINQIQKESGLNRGDFARAIGYPYHSFKEFYSQNRSTIQPPLKRALIMYQLLSIPNRATINNMAIKK